MFENQTGAIPRLNHKATNMAIEWKNWKEQFKMFLRATNLEGEPDKRTVALLLHHMGPESFQIANSFNINLDDVKYDVLVAKFDIYYVPKLNIAMERHKFFSRKQNDGESLESYVTILKNLSKSCEFGSLREGLVKDIFICM